MDAALQLDLTPRPSSLAIRMLHFRIGKGLGEINVAPFSPPIYSASISDARSEPCSGLPRSHKSTRPPGWDRRRPAPTAIVSY